MYMNGVSLAAARLEETLADQLYELVPEEDETQAAFLGRLAVIADEFGDRIPLSEREIEYANQLVPSWQLYATRIHLKELGIARRSIRPNAMQQQQIKEEHNPPKRVIGHDETDDTVLLSAQSRLTGSDIASVFRIEQYSNRFPNSPAKRLPKPRRKPEGINGTTTSDPAELHERSKLHLTQKERAVLRLLACNTSMIAKQLGIDDSMPSKRVSYIMKRNKINRVQLLAIAAESGLIDMSLLPAITQPYELTDNEQKILREHTFIELGAAAKAMDLGSKNAAIKLWRSVYDKLGLSPKDRSRTRAFLVAKRDGSI